MPRWRNTPCARAGRWKRRRAASCRRSGRIRKRWPTPSARPPCSPSAPRKNCCRRRWSTPSSPSACARRPDAGAARSAAASRKAAEAVLAALREALGSFPAQPLTAAETPRALMTDWLAHGKLPGGLALGDECELRDPAGGAVIRCRRQELESAEVRAHLKRGKQVFQLGLQFEDRASFLLGDDLVIRKLRFLDVVQDVLDADGRDSAEAELDARFALMTLELERLLLEFEKWFGLERPDEASKKAA